LALNDIWLFPEIKFASKVQRFQDTENIQEKKSNGTESCSTTGVPKIFPIMAAS